MRQTRSPERPATVPLPPTHPALYGVGSRGAWLTLRVLREVHTRRWARYVGQPDNGRARGHHLLNLADNGLAHLRLLLAIPSFWSSPRHPGEVWYWGQGFAAARRQPRALDGLLGERVRVLDIPTAAKRLGLTPEGVGYQIRTGKLYPIYVVDEQDHRTRRMVFAAQVSAQLGRATAWRDIRTLLPDQPRLNATADDLTVRPSPAPLPVSRDLATPYRQREALALAHELGWLRFEGSSGSVFTASVLPGPRRNLRVELPAPAVEPWLLGLGDGLGGQGSMVAYRPDLG